MIIDPTGLLPYQPAAVEQILCALRKYRAAADGSDMGVGKTYAAGAVIRALDVPTLIVCPQVSISGWKRMGKALGVEFDVLNYEMLRTGKTPYGEWENPRVNALKQWHKCLTCQRHFDPDTPQPCPYHYLGIHCVDTKKLPHNYGKFHWYPGIRQLVFDEVHRCSALSGLQTDMLIAAKRQNISTLGLSATIADNPLNLRAFGYALGLHSLVKRADGSPGFFEWAFSLGCRRLPVGGWHFAVGEQRRQSIMKKIHAQIFPERGTRIRIADLGDAFPDCQITAELYDIEKSGRINQLYSEMDSAVGQLHNRIVAKAKEKPGSELHPLNKILRARQEVELLKIPIFMELVEDARAQGFHVVLFVNFRQTIDELCKRLKTQCRIDGSQVGEAGHRQRQKNMDDFLADKEPVAVCSNDAGAESIDLCDMLGNHPRLGLVSLGFSARKFRQVSGRLRRAVAKSKSLYRIVLIAGTIEEKIHKAVSPKLDCLDLLNDGDLMAANLPLTQFYPDAILHHEEIQN